MIAIWFAKLFGKREPKINAGDYLSSILVSKQISKTARNKLNKIIKKAGTGNKAYNKIRIGTKRLNLKVGVWGIKLNLGINISNFFVSNIYSFLQYRYW